MARWLNNGVGEGGTTRTCSCCRMTQTVNIYNDKVMFKYCPYCGARMEDVDISEPMTANEFHVKRVVPMRQELRLLEKEWGKRNRKEKAEAAGLKIANCANCAYSCVLMISDHNECLGGYCTCCHDYCDRWMPDTPVSVWLRKNKPYNDYLIHKLEDMFGDDFLKCNDVDLILKALQLMDEVKEKAKENNK